MERKGNWNGGFAVIRRSFSIYLGAFILILGVVSVWILSKDGIPEGAKYFQKTDDNGVILHVLQTKPSNISLNSINDNVVRSGTNGINGGFFWENHLLSIAVMDGMPANGVPKAYGSGWYNVKYARGTMVYDRVTRMVDVQRAASVEDLHLTDATKFWAQGGVSMNLKDESGWYNVAVTEEKLPFPDDKRLRSAMAYDNSGEIYLVVTSTKCTAEQFRTAIKRNVAVGNLNEAIFLDGDGSSQLLVGNVKLEGDDRTVVQMIGVKGEN
ncbi:phosphodiester glycosidase family protein [Paenibacillus antarcticus]|uniref:Phosphodiester glycosidase domain-containing protein n=1 Tax=Paenibacillus antarcticus TaxID=253703 RepID=A0A168PY11_9BACL|nr:phosphodiester glycosidase family protein [Paenibacillus antarcticus]OAB47178.1 hypothetical protein PBAT_07830 [Paenibacillus antarcticus]